MVFTAAEALARCPLVVAGRRDGARRRARPARGEGTAVRGMRSVRGRLRLPARARFVLEIGMTDSTFRGSEISARVGVRTTKSPHRPDSREGAAAAPSSLTRVYTHYSTSVERLLSHRASLHRFSGPRVDWWTRPRRRRSGRREMSCSFLLLLHSVSKVLVLALCTLGTSRRGNVEHQVTRRAIPSEAGGLGQPGRAYQ